ncbi:MAG TPA: zinc-ribbon and DUF3426 domain-containing protein [Casimicrobiaceae bacterium]|nr:zinc-ribbon and DUF3426 domain-containing protein [Casimicrobiaceae bacterium]
MADEKYTRCPECKTVFRVTPAQLSMRMGQVRCGHCRTVFDGSANLIQLAPVAHDGPPPMDDEANGPLTITLRSAAALEPVNPPATPASKTDAKPAATPKVAPHADDDVVDYDHRFAWDRPKKRSPRRTAFLVVTIVALIAALIAQIGWHYRDVIAAHLPSTRPMYARLCALAGCAIGPLRQIAGLSIDASDLQADAAHKGLLMLTATVRNRAAFPVQYPHIEFTLTDSQDRVVVRRALAPDDYASGTADIPSGIPGNGEVAFKLFLDASATTQSGYRVFLFYP